MKMATRPVQVTDPYELMLLLGQKAALLATCLNKVPHPQSLPIADIGKELGRMGELHLALKEAIAAMPKQQTANEGRRA